MSETIIPEFFNNKTIFITGGSGFIGKVLIEKLLRSCPGIKKIYLLMRPKREKSAEERIKSITDLPLFDRLRNEDPDKLKKIVYIAGDVSELKLGLSPENRRILIDQVEIIFHGAASVRFDDSLTDSVLLNTRGTRELIALALEMKQLQVLTHISTTYCHTNRHVIGEQLYPPHADWEKTIEIAENVDEQTLNILTKKYISPLPNTYTFSKGLAEHVVYDLANGKIPLVIFRPSIVISSIKDPIEGWIDNFNGPVGLLVASGKGIVRTVFAEPDIIADYVPVDLVVKALIISAWKKGISKESLQTTFYNGSNNNTTPVTMGEIVEMGKTICADVPLNGILWYPNGSVTTCYYNYFLKLIFYQLLPAILIDTLLKMSGNKPMLVKIQRRIYIANMALQYFLTNQWVFINDNAVALEDNLLPLDQKDFSYNKDGIAPLQYFLRAGRGARKYLLKEDDSTFESAKKHSRRMWMLSKIFNFLWYLIVVYILFYKIDVISIGKHKYEEWYMYLTTD